MVTVATVHDGCCCGTANDGAAMAWVIVADEQRRPRATGNDVGVANAAGLISLVVRDSRPSRVCPSSHSRRCRGARGIGAATGLADDLKCRMTATSENKSWPAFSRGPRGRHAAQAIIIGVGVNAHPAAIRRTCASARPPSRMIRLAAGDRGCCCMQFLFHCGTGRAASTRPG